LRKLSELEGVCLGIVSKFQPCTAYRVRSILRDSPSSHWRASAGSVYPLLARLDAGKLISTTADENDGRGRKHLKVTPDGRQALRHWIMAGADQELISAISDPVRTRTFFLGMLDVKQRGHYLKELISRMEIHLSETKTRLDHSLEFDDLYGELGSLGAMKVTQTRLEWLKLVRKRLAKQ